MNAADMKAKCDAIARDLAKTLRNGGAINACREIARRIAAIPVEADPSAVDYRASYLAARRAIVEARRRLAKGRGLWNGPVHECDSVLSAFLNAPIFDATEADPRDAEALLEGAKCFREAVVRSCDETLTRQKHEIRAKDAQIAALKDELDAATSTFEDEQAAHQETLNMVSARDAQIAGLREAAERHQVLRCSGFGRPGARPIDKEGARHDRRRPRGQRAEGRGEMTRAEEYDALVADCALAAFRAWDKFAHSPRIDSEPPMDRALRGMSEVARAVLAVIAEKAKEWPTERMTCNFGRDFEAEIWRAMFAASPLVKPEPASEP